jgi:hypothetical protein
MIAEEFPDGPAAVFFQEARPGPREPDAPDPGLPGLLHFLPTVLGPPEPPVGILVEDEDRLIAELCELGAPTRPAPDGSVLQDLADHVDLLPGVDLVPDRLEHLPDPGGVRIGPVHQPGDVGEAHVPVAELFGGQDPDPPGPGDVISRKRKVGLPDPEPLRLDAELVFGPVGASAVKNALFLSHHRPLSAVSNPGRMPTIARPWAGTLLLNGDTHTGDTPFLLDEKTRSVPARTQECPR